MYVYMGLCNGADRISLSASVLTYRPKETLSVSVLVPEILIQYEDYGEGTQQTMILILRDKPERRMKSFDEGTCREADLTGGGKKGIVGKEPVNEYVSEGARGSPERGEEGLTERGGDCFPPTALFSYNVSNQFPSQNALCERFYIVYFAASRQPSTHAD